MYTLTSVFSPERFSVNYRFLVVIVCLLLSSLLWQSPCESASRAKAKGISKKTTTSDWRADSLAGDDLVTKHKYAEADTLFNKILPRARKEAPGSLDLALCLVRYARGLYAEQNYKKALPLLQEAQQILGHKSETKTGRYILWRCLAEEGAVQVSLQHYPESEYLARKAVAYIIAFPDITSHDDVKASYTLLKICLKNQNKVEESNNIASILKQLN